MRKLLYLVIALLAVGMIMCTASADSSASTEMNELGNEYVVRDAYGNKYTSLDEALNAITDYGYLYLLNNVDYEGTLVLTKVTLKLEGYRLAADNIVGLRGASVEDNSLDKSGRLIVTGEIVLSVENTQIPIKVNENTETGTSEYLLATVTMNQQVISWEGDTLSFKMLPRFGMYDVDSDGVLDAEDGDYWIELDLLQSEFASTGLGICVHLEWNNGNGDLDFWIDEALVQQVYTNNSVFEVTVTGVENLTDLSISSAVVSCGARAYGTAETKPGTSASNPITLADGDSITVAPGQTCYYNVSAYHGYTISLENDALVGENVLVGQEGYNTKQADEEYLIEGFSFYTAVLKVINNEDTSVTYIVSFKKSA